MACDCRKSHHCQMTDTIVKTTGILSNDIEVYRIKGLSANGGYWCESITHPHIEAQGKKNGTIDKKGILLFEENFEVL